MGELVGRLLPVAVLFVLLFALRIHILLTKMGAHVRKQEYRVVAEYIGAGIHYTWCMGVNIVVTSYLQSKEYSKASMKISLLRGFVFTVAYLLTLSKIFGITGVL